MHAHLPHVQCTRAIAVSVSYFSAASIGLFFIVSGALLLRKTEVGLFSTSDFLKHRFSKVLWPTIIWFLVGYTLKEFGVRNDELGVLWFMYSLMGLYLLTPILSRWIAVATRREIEFYLLIWAISLCYPLLNIFFDLNENHASWIYYFHGYVGYYVLGFYLRQYGLSKRGKIGMAAAFVILSLLLPICSYVLQWGWPMIPVFWYRSISVALMCVMWWLVIEKCAHFFECCRPVITELSKLSFGIYLVHILVMRNFLWKFEWMQSLEGLTQILVCAFLTFVISAAISWMISKLKFSKYIIGV